MDEAIRMERQRAWKLPVAKRCAVRGCELRFDQRQIIGYILQEQNQRLASY